MRVLLLSFFFVFSSFNTNNNITEAEIAPINFNEIINHKKDSIREMYDTLALESLISFKAFEQGLIGLENIAPANTNILSIIDFTLPSTAKRMVVLDLKEQKILHHTIVAHGRNSGENYATSFSNTPNSYQSSLGFYLTENTYQGENGYSLRLEGLDKGFNDNAKSRAVVIHGADYCSYEFIKNNGRIGRSMGCPSLPRDINDEVINTIKNGTLLYIYADNEEYAQSSEYLTPNRL
ncbi:MAG: murein L,D-transpeptidase catalytic domain family protein [Bacteroidota bacterium]|nr:murein L,D-transpeptidase catalytic domain family protein [Bacteroidota bacterium]